jgi:hypothetical protein
MTTELSPERPADGSPEAARQAGNAAEELERMRQRLAHLFRVSLSEGRIHPLLHLVQQYRLGEFR